MKFKYLVNALYNFSIYTKLLSSKEELEKVKSLIEEKEQRLHSLNKQCDDAYIHRHLLSFSPEQIHDIYQKQLQSKVSQLIEKLDNVVKKAVLKGDKNVKFKVGNPKPKDIEALNYIVDKLKVEGFDAHLSKIELYTDGLTFAETQIFILLGLENYYVNDRNNTVEKLGEYCLNS